MPETTMVGVLVMAYGGPNSLDDIEAYLLDVRGGRPTRPELVAEIRERYHLIGGRSPILELTQAQARALEAALNTKFAPDGFAIHPSDYKSDGSAGERSFRTYVGMRHWFPYIKEAVQAMVADGVRQAVGIVMAPHYSRMSIGAYIKKAEEARQAAGANLDMRYVESYHCHPLYLQALAERVTEALARFPAEQRASIPVIFTAHSLPRRILEWDDPYPRQLQATAQAVADLVGLARWQFAYQSAGATADPWLGPDVADVVRDLAAAGDRAVLVAPIGFVSDHVEILFDLDKELKQVAHEVGVHLERTVSLNDAPLFIAALADVVRQRLEAGA